MPASSGALNALGTLASKLPFLQKKTPAAPAIKEAVRLTDDFDGLGQRVAMASQRLQARLADLRALRAACGDSNAEINATLDTAIGATEALAGKIQRKQAEFGNHACSFLAQTRQEGGVPHDHPARMTFVDNGAALVAQYMEVIGTFDGLITKLDKAELAAAAAASPATAPNDNTAPTARRPGPLRCALCLILVAIAVALAFLIAWHILPDYACLGAFATAALAGWIYYHRPPDLEASQTATDAIEAFFRRQPTLRKSVENLACTLGSFRPEEHARVRAFEQLTMGFLRALDGPEPTFGAMLKTRAREVAQFQLNGQRIPAPLPAEEEDTATEATWRERMDAAVQAATPDGICQMAMLCAFSDQARDIVANAAAIEVSNDAQIPMQYLPVEHFSVSLTALEGSDNAFEGIIRLQLVPAWQTFGPANTKGDNSENVHVMLQFTVSKDLISVMCLKVGHRRLGETLESALDFREFYGQPPEETVPAPGETVPAPAANGDAAPAARPRRHSAPPGVRA